MKVGTVLLPSVSSGPLCKGEGGGVKALEITCTCTSNQVYFCVCIAASNMSFLAFGAHFHPLASPVCCVCDQCAMFCRTWPKQWPSGVWCSTAPISWTSWPWASSSRAWPAPEPGPALRSSTSLTVRCCLLLPSRSPPFS